ncbi:endo-1,4-beta-xylanase [Asticcacaulis sp. AC402]|uniref:endo-1,4-beta-xylanase n=1 Tax=Asticcacaulis sp. AC402 TaxID=1282361 RepID=UPI0003C40DB9|nr:endo-1,4-beta-xylanase [Asticcacaulis sp. AC402]ESQ73516.1 hypothetical protein ABAC402_18950 [Asticcacaulis sp. AC402]
MTSANLARRGVLMGAAAGLAGTAAMASPGVIPLKTLAAAKGVVFGSSIAAGPAGTLTGSLADADYRRIVVNECAAIVPENELKAYTIVGWKADYYDFKPADEVAAFAADNGLKLRGHTLLWNRTDMMPAWMAQADFGPNPAAAAETWLRDYIGRVCGRYADQIYEWDVVNETILPETGELRVTPFTQALGFDALRITFEAAREHAPRARLVYSDYMTWGWGPKHRAGVLKLLERFRRDNVPVDALGVQGHIGGAQKIDRKDRREWLAFITDVTAMGYKLAITEFDVNDRKMRGDIARQDAGMAAMARDFLDLMLSFRELDQVLCWGMVDSFSWIQDEAKKRGAGPSRPNPYDAQFRPKPMRDALAAAFAAAPLR